MASPEVGVGSISVVAGFLRSSVRFFRHKKSCEIADIRKMPSVKA
jgi:hypothetical protein